MKLKLTVLLAAVVVAMGLLLGATAASAAIIGVAITDDGNDIPENWNSSAGAGSPELIDEDGNETTIRHGLITPSLLRINDWTPIAETVPIHTPDLSSLNTFGEGGETLTIKFVGLNESLDYNVWVIGLHWSDEITDWTITGATTEEFEQSVAAGKLIFNSEVGDSSRTFASYALQVTPDPGDRNDSDDGFITITGTSKTQVDPNVHVAGFAIEPITGPPPETVTIGGNVSGLVGGDLVLQNNGGDDLPITRQR